MASPEATEADITLTTPADLLSAIPYLVGYVPRDSLVLVGLNGKRIAVTLRVDLPHRDQSTAALGISPDIMTRNRVEAVVIVGYGSPERVTRSVDALRNVVDAAGVELVDAMRVTDGRFWSYTCTEPSCCPAEGQPVPKDSRVDTALTVAGMAPVPDRPAIAARLNVVDAQVASRIVQAVETAACKAAADRDCGRDPQAAAITSLAAAFGAAVEGQFPDDETTAVLGWAITDTKTGMAAAMAAVDAATDLTAALEVCVWLTRHHTGTYRAHASALTAFAAWRRGDGILAAEAIRVAFSINSRITTARIMAGILNRGVPPSEIPPMQPSETD